MASPLPCSECGCPLPAHAIRCERCGAPSPSPTSVATIAAVLPPPLKVGEVLEGNWRLCGKLGAGGMGAVFLAEDVALRRKVAVKVLAAQLCHDAEFVARFEREARATARLEHPNIVPVYAVGRHGPRPFIVMKALFGVTLSKLLRNRMVEGKALAPREILSLFGQLCAGLGFLHQQGYVHRDVKPGNVFVGEDAHLTILDFGILRDPSAVRLTRSGALLGTPQYVAPEQFLEPSKVDPRADVYAVGVMLFECIAGKPPFSSDPVSLIRLHAAGTPPPDLAALAPGLPQAVAAVVAKALAKKPADRYASAGELWAALERAWRPEPAEPVAPDAAATLPAVPFSELRAAAEKAAQQELDPEATETSSGPASAVTPTEPLLAPPAAAPRRSSPAGAILIATAAALLAGLGAWYLWGRGIR